MVLLNASTLLFARIFGHPNESGLDVLLPNPTRTTHRTFVLPTQLHKSVGSRSSCWPPERDVVLHLLSTSLPSAMFSWSPLRLLSVYLREKLSNVKHGTIFFRATCKAAACDQCCGHSSVILRNTTDEQDFIDIPSSFPSFQWPRPLGSCDALLVVPGRCSVHVCRRYNHSFRNGGHWSAQRL